ncbi:MAG: NAD(P)-dependent oxidoreductase [Bacteroidetes bacterium]|nr:NAD(P)-dependent oxidoreductase [Bacteroidota bacterium]MBS1649596.1 NAD(P)-dependent oxidoreductase [Bacteroidota bacterium]
MKEKILITGATGFIGGFIVEQALAAGLEVYANIRKTSNTQYLSQKEIHFIELNLSSVEILTQQLNNYVQEFGGFDYIIHNAGVTQTKTKSDFFKVNYECAKNLADAVIACKMKVKKFTLISSLAVYGPGNADSFQKIETFNTQHPISTYGKSKLMGEEYIKSLENFPFIIINPTAVYGPRDKDFFEFVKLINKGFEPYIGLHKQMVSMIYVKDLASVIVQATIASIKNKSYIVSDTKDYNKLELGEAVKSILHKKTIKIKIPLFIIKSIITVIDGIYKLFGTIPFLNIEKINEISAANWLCNATEIWNDLQTQPQYFLQNGMEETIAWYKENKWIE